MRINKERANKKLDEIFCDYIKHNKCIDYYVEWDEVKAEMRKLRESGADFCHVVRQNGKSLDIYPLDLAILSMSSEIVEFCIDEFFVKEKMNLNIVNPLNKTALDTLNGIEESFPKSQEIAEIKAILLKNGAKTVRQIAEEQSKLNSQAEKRFDVDKTGEKSKNKANYLKKMQRKQGDKSRDR